MVEAEEVAYIDNLSRWNTRLGAPHIRMVSWPTPTELRIVEGYRRAGALDPGESEVLAIAKNRLWVAVIDEMPGHCLAEDEGIANASTLEILVQGVTAGIIDESSASDAWRDMQRWWERAPWGELTGYLHGRPIWRPCP